MNLENITLTIIALLLSLIITASIWWAIFTKKIKNLSNKVSERLQVIDIVLAIKKEFLIKLVNAAKIKASKEIPKEIIKDPLYLWSSLEREVYIAGLNKWEKEVNKEIKKTNKEKNKAVVETLKIVSDATERINHNIFIYNDQVLKYNYLLISKQGRFFLKTSKYQERELINVSLKQVKTKDS